MSSASENKIAEIEKLIENEQFLQLSVLDVQDYDGTLVVSRSILRFRVDEWKHRFIELRLISMQLIFF